MLEQQFRIKDAQIENNSRLVDQAKKLASQAQQLHYLDSPAPEVKKYSRAFWNWKSDKKEAMVQLEIKNYQKDFFHGGATT